jgi:arsenite methyltransferase
MTVWIKGVLGVPLPQEGEVLVINGQRMIMSGGVLRETALAEPDQAQTRDAFAFKWAQRNTYSSDAMQKAQRVWFKERYGGRDLFAHLGNTGDDKPVVLDAGCGSGFSAALIFAPQFKTMRYVGVDVSRAVEIAAETIRPLAPESLFVQADLMHLPFVDGSFDVVIAEGVIHHTPSTRSALLALARLVRTNGIIAFYVYAKKAPVREFTDDYIRDQISHLPPEQAWKALEPLTRLGIALGELGKEIEIPDDIPLLGISKGRIDVQRLFYWAVCKTYYRPDFSFEEMNHINFDWFAPKYSHRQTPEEVRTWCNEAKLVIEHMKVEEAGITVVARRPAGWLEHHSV